MPTGASLPLIRLPGFEWPANARLDFQPLERAMTRHQESQFQLARLERDDARFGLERERFGLDTRRLGIEEDRARLAREEAERQEQERRSVRLGNMAFGVRNRSDRTARSADAIRLIWQTPGVAELLAREGGIRLNREESTAEDYDHALDFLINRPLTPRQPTILHGAPGTGFFRFEAGPGGTDRLTPLGQVPERRPPLSDTALGRLTDEGGRARNIFRLTNSWDDSYTIPGWRGAVGGGDMMTWFGRTFSNAPDRARAAATWWQDYQANVELVRRNQIFGASLTAQEQRAWLAATITPNMAPDIVRRNLQMQHEIIENHMINHARALVQQGQDPRVIASALGISPEILRPGQTPPSSGGPPPGPGQPPPTTTTTTPGQPREGEVRTDRGVSYVYRGGQWYLQGRP